MKPGYTERRILIWGKTYPELSKKHIETVCTAGVLETGEPVRLYPITFRYLNDEQFKLYQWVSAGIRKNPDDPRPESHKIDLDSIRVGERIPTTSDEWGKRSEYMFKDQRWQFATFDDLVKVMQFFGRDELYDFACHLFSLLIKCPGYLYLYSVFTEKIFLPFAQC